MIFLDDAFPELDVTLRRGAHVNRDDYERFQFLVQHYELLARFYSKFGSRLIQHPDGFFFLLSQGGSIPQRLLSKAVMHLGMFIALKARDPEITRASGKIPIAALFREISTSITPELLAKIYAPKQREASVDAKIKEELERSIKVLSELGMITLEKGWVTPRQSIRRFAEFARHSNAPGEVALQVLQLQKGAILIVDEVEVLTDGDICDEGTN